MVSLSQYHSQQQRIIDAKLTEFLQRYQKFLPALYDGLHYAVFSGGKRIRPLLVVAAAEAVGGSAEAALPAAVAVELLHTYTLVHDDLPAMDDDELRRGKPTVHVQFGEANGILIGDALQALAFAALAPTPQAPQLIAELGDAGLKVVGGQWQDMAVTADTVGEKEIEFIHEYKTANLLRTSVRLGGISGGATDEQLADLTKYGTALGHVFQLIDDVLDEGEEKVTALSVYGRKGTQERAEKYKQEAKQSLEHVPSPEILQDILTFIFERTT